jgi:DNA-binding IclR family transcriptional regulator
VIPAQRDAIADARLDGAAIRVLFYLSDGLIDVNVPAPIKVSSVASALRMKDVTVWRKLNLLVECGYLRRSGTERVRTYQLVYARVA